MAPNLWFSKSSEKKNSPFRGSFYLLMPAKIEKLFTVDGDLRGGDVLGSLQGDAHP
ncbi:hypothetical protein G5S_0216 [Chlamydia pecorum E58]|uniref:Uncharacterized protein n=1 Tax=Chlamydia pecorum (strain ATCC VR-628 / DSM 29919 / E58) TaxID=331635 RepID=A0AA34WHS8_CHLPE|nr:hypothetical protein G5S_0216 [Chlamydia pecorum E58]